MLQEHPSQQNSVAPVRAQQGSRAAAQQAEHGRLYAEPMPCDHQQRTECGWHQGYPFVSDCYALVGASCSRSCPSTSILGYIEESPRRCSSMGTSWDCQFFFWRQIFVLTVLVIYISTHTPGFESVSGLSVLLVIQVISYKTDVTKYMCIFPVCISTPNVISFTCRQLEISKVDISNCRQHRNIHHRTADNIEISTIDINFKALVGPPGVHAGAFWSPECHCGA